MKDKQRLEELLSLKEKEMEEITLKLENFDSNLTTENVAL